MWPFDKIDGLPWHHMTISKAHRVKIDKSMVQQNSFLAHPIQFEMI